MLIQAADDKQPQVEALESPIRRPDVGMRRARILAHRETEHPWFDQHVRSDELGAIG